MDLQGRKGELAVAIYTGLSWNDEYVPPEGMPAHRLRADVGLDIEVRTRKNHRLEELVRQDDDPRLDFRFVLAYVFEEEPWTVWIAGWRYGYEIVEDRGAHWLGPADDFHKPGWAIGWRVLRPVCELLG